jgi:hypothetical protein
MFNLISIYVNNIQFLHLYFIYLLLFIAKTEYCLHIYFLN